MLPWTLQWGKIQTEMSSELSYTMKGNSLIQNTKSKSMKNPLHNIVLLEKSLNEHDMCECEFLSFRDYKLKHKILFGLFCACVCTHTYALQILQKTED